MQLAEYAEKVRTHILQTPNVLSHSLSYEDRPPTAGLAKGGVTFSDGSRFHFKEFLRLTEPVIRLKYAYQYVSVTGSLLFRYDNALDPAAKHLPTYPDHKHLPDSIAPAAVACGTANTQASPISSNPTRFERRMISLRSKPLAGRSVMSTGLRGDRYSMNGRMVVQDTT
ncbi:MAG: hypothetical protein FJ249_06730 [Nitrospira sp.]|nr:hypothetical protein [Nitrospira sp.]